LVSPEFHRYSYGGVPPETVTVAIGRTAGEANQILGEKKIVDEQGFDIFTLMGIGIIFTAIVIGISYCYLNRR